MPQITTDFRCVAITHITYLLKFGCSRHQLFALWRCNLAHKQKQKYIPYKNATLKDIISPMGCNCLIQLGSNNIIITFESLQPNEWPDFQDFASRWAIFGTYFEGQDAALVMGLDMGTYQWSFDSGNNDGDEVSPIVVGRLIRAYEGGQSASLRLKARRRL